MSNNLVNIANGKAVVTGTAGTLGGTSTDVNKVNTIADMLAACVNTAGPGDSTGNCATLLADTPPTGSTAADTLQAAVFLKLNSTSNNANGSAANMTALFGLVGNNVFVTHNSGTTMTLDQFTGGVIAATNRIEYPFNNLSQYMTPRKVAVDGNNIAWVLNRGTGTVSEITTAGAILSPTPVGFVHAGIATVTGIAIDPSGNVWVANGAVSTSPADWNSVFEIIGCAAPATTPLAAAIKSGSVGTKP